MKNNAAAEFIKAQIYGDEALTLFDSEKRNIHLKKSADLGLKGQKKCGLNIYA